MSKRSRSIPEKIKCMLWGRAAGRCEFAGCNRPLSYHVATKEPVNLAEAAHIVGFSEDGPRGEAELSADLASDIENLMLLCRACHRTIDTDPSAYPVPRLIGMKHAHEDRIETVVTVAPETQSHVLLYDANVGDHAGKVSYRAAQQAMLPERYPAERAPIDLGMNGAFQDHTDRFWEIECQHLRTAIGRHVRPRLADGTIRHLSVFAFAPQPLLMLLGYLLSDIHAADVYQLHREPPGWCWPEDGEATDFVAEEPETAEGDPALVLALSATVRDERITACLGPRASIWRLTVPSPHNDVLRSRQQLRKYREQLRQLMDRIKMRHGDNSVLHVFPAAPLAAAVEFGRILMPKADLPVRTYDHNRRTDGFAYALDLDTCTEVTHDAG